MNYYMVDEFDFYFDLQPTILFLTVLTFHDECPILTNVRSYGNETLSFLFARHLGTVGILFGLVPGYIKIAGIQSKHWRNEESTHEIAFIRFVWYVMQILNVQH